MYNNYYRYGNPPFFSDSCILLQLCMYKNEFHTVRYLVDIQSSKSKNITSIA